MTPNITTKCQLVSFSLLECNCLPAFLSFLLHLFIHILFMYSVIFWAPTNYLVLFYRHWNIKCAELSGGLKIPVLIELPF